MGKAVVETEVQKLKRERDLLMQEVMELRKDQLMTVEKMDSLNHRMQAAELRQKQMVSFLAKVLQNPAFIGHLKQLKGQREVASMRGKRKFIKHHQHQPIFSASAKPMNQQLVKYTESSESSDALLHVCKHGEGNRIPEHILKDIADKLDLDTDGEVIGQSDESAGLKEKNILNPQMDSEFPGSDYLISLPEDIANMETEYIPQEAMFPDAMAHSDACVSAGVWNIGVDVGGSMLSSEPAVWDDSLGHYNDAREMEAAAGSCSLWDLGLSALEEDLDIGNFMGGESSLQEHKDDAGQPNADCSKDLEP